MMNKFYPVFTTYPSRVSILNILHRVMQTIDILVQDQSPCIQKDWQKKETVPDSATICRAILLISLAVIRAMTVCAELILY